MERKRNFLLVLPVMVLPFIVFFCWVVGIVGGDALRAQERNGAHRFNLTLPTAAGSKDSAWNKMNFYEQADRDSAKRRSLMKQDPLFARPMKTSLDSSEQHMQR